MMHVTNVRILNLLAFQVQVLIDTSPKQVPGYYKRNRHFQCCIEKKLLMI